MGTHNDMAHTTHAEPAPEAPPIADRNDDPSFIGRWLPLLLLALIALFALHACLTQPSPKPSVPGAVPFDAAAAAHKANVEAQKALAALAPGAAPEAVTRALNLLVVNFADGSSDLPPAAAEIAAAAARAIGLLPASLRVQITGHTDNRGAADANLALSRQRAEAMRNALLAAGLAPERLQTAGAGDTQPVASNATAEGRFRNRRIEFALAPQ